MMEYSEGYEYGDKDNFNVTDTVGRISTSVMEEVFTKHGGIDWEKSCSFTINSKNAIK
jgi:hypothetical protein